MSYWEYWQRGYSSPWQNNSSWDEWDGGDVWTGWEADQELYRRNRRWRQESSSSSSSSDNSLRRNMRLQETQRAAGALEERARQSADRVDEGREFGPSLAESAR